MSGLKFTNEAAKRLEALYTTPDVVAQHSEALRKLGLAEGASVIFSGSGPGFLSFRSSGELLRLCRTEQHGLPGCENTFRNVLREDAACTDHLASGRRRSPLDVVFRLGGPLMDSSIPGAASVASGSWFRPRNSAN